MSLPILRPPRRDGELPLWHRAMTLFARKGWRDEKATLQAAKAAGGNTSATYGQIGSTNFSGWSFSASTANSLQIAFHIQHDYIPGGKVLIHVHWHSTGTGDARWGFEYVKANGHSREEFDFTTSTTVYVEQTNVPGSANGSHMIAEFDIADTITGLEPDALVICRLFRDGGHANDTLNAVAYAHFCDVHYEVDRFATPSRAPDFYNYT